MRRINQSFSHCTKQLLIKVEYVNKFSSLYKYSQYSVQMSNLTLIQDVLKEKASYHGNKCNIKMPTTLSKRTKICWPKFRSHQVNIDREMWVTIIA